MNYILTVISLILSVFQIVNPFIAQLIPGESYYFEEWSEEQTYTEDYAITMEKDPDKDFVILSLTDIQLEKWQAFSDEGKTTWATIDELVEKTNPDLIVLLGDNAWATSTYLEAIKRVDSYGIPWAPVLGNHDGKCCVNEFWCAYRLYKAKNCLFKFGPEGMGYGNYIINITENGEIVHSLFFMDTHSNLKEGGNINGEQGSNYDHLWENQMEWYKWAVSGISELAGKTVQSTVFMHIPVVEYKDAWEAAYDEETGTFRDEYKDTSFGVVHEYFGCADQNNGFFALCQELGSTKDIICGHDHVNNASILYEGIRLTYSLKCGPGGYWEEGMSGGTVETVSSDGTTNVSHMFIDIEQ